MKKNTVACIFARGGSKGVPRKNIRLLAGKPLIAHSIETAMACPSVDRVVVSTDDDEIAKVAREAGAEVPFARPTELAQDDSPEWLSWQHAVRELFPLLAPGGDELMVSLPATSPLRSVEDVEACIKLMRGDSWDAVITVTPARRSPFFNMVAVQDDGSVRIALASGGQVFRRQDSPTLFDITTVAYAVRPSFVLRANRLFEGRVGAVVVPEERAMDIDTEHDFRIADFLAGRRVGAT